MVRLNSKFSIERLEITQTQQLWHTVFNSLPLWPYEMIYKEMFMFIKVEIEAVHPALN